MVARLQRRLIALRLPPGAAFVEALDAAWRAGDAVLPLPLDLPPPQLAGMLESLRPALVRHESGEVECPDPRPVDDGVALVVATSGTTGRPKGVELTHEALEASARASLARLGAERSSRWLCCLPLHHIAGLQVLVRSRVLGTDPIIHPRFDPQTIAAETSATHVSVVPTMLVRLLDAGIDLSRFAAIVVGGGVVAPSLITRARRSGAWVIETYGMTETSGGCVYDGVPLDGVDVRIEDDGRIAISGPMLLGGYRLRPDLTDRSLRDGWFITSDHGEISRAGRLRVHGRADGVIVTGGELVSPQEVAALLTEHPLVAEAGVIGVADDEWGQRVVAVCVPRDPATPPTLEELRAFVAERAAPYKAPRELVVVEHLPRTAKGDVPREQLSSLVAGATGA